MYGGILYNLACWRLINFLLFDAGVLGIHHICLGTVVQVVTDRSNQKCVKRMHVWVVSI